MKELVEYRNALINKLVSQAHEIRAACLAVDDPFRPLNANSWNVHQIAAHVRDVDQLEYVMCVRRTITEDNPVFQNFDGDGYLREHYSPNESLQTMLDGFVQSVEDLAGLLRAQPVEAWARISSHEKFGGDLTLQLWVERSLAHIEEHLKTVNNG